LTLNPGTTNYPHVGRRKINFDCTNARFPEGTFARIDAVLEGKEKQADLIRLAVETELRRREKAGRPKRKARKKDPANR
jgi:hypothetical protein